jgi:hypothetical protein
MGAKFEAHEHNGSLILVFPKRFEENIKTTKGLSDATDADIIVVDKRGPDGQPLAFLGARLFGNLARSVRNDIGGQVLGRLNQITSANGNTPWVMDAYSDQEAAMAMPVLTAYQQGQFKSTEPPMQAPAPAAYSPGPATPAAAPVAAAQWQQQAAPAPQWNAPPPAAPAAPQWTAPAPATPTPAPVAPAPPAAAPAVDPALVAFLAARGVTVTPDMSQAQCETIASSFQ